MKIYVEMTEYEYDFYKKFRENERLVYNNFTKLLIDYHKQNKDLSKEQKDFIQKVQYMLKTSFTLFEIKEE